MSIITLVIRLKPYYAMKITIIKMKILTGKPALNRLISSAERRECIFTDDVSFPMMPHLAWAAL